MIFLFQDDLDLGPASAHLFVQGVQNLCTVFVQYCTVFVSYVMVDFDKYCTVQCTVSEAEILNSSKTDTRSITRAFSRRAVDLPRSSFSYNN